MIRKLRFSVLAVVLAVLATTVPVAAHDDLKEELDRVHAQAEAVSAEIASAKTTRTGVTQDIAGTEARLDELLVQIGRTQLELAAITDELTTQQGILAAVRAQLDLLYDELAHTQARLDESNADAITWARQIYMSAGQDEAYLALEASRLGDIAVGLEYLDRIATENSRAILVYESLRRLEQELATRVADKEQAVAAEVSELGHIEQELAALNDQLAQQHASVEAELHNQQTNLATLDAEIVAFEGELASLEAEQARIEKAIAAEQSSGGGGDGGGGDAATSAWVRPVPGRVTSAFGPRTHPILGYVRMHTGVDFTAPYGQEIRAAQSGRVILAATFGGYGKTVVVDHGGGVATLYAHQSELAVGYGDQVTAGQKVGAVGSTGLSTGPHLHFEVRVGGTPVDPVPYL